MHTFYEAGGSALWNVDISQTDVHTVSDNTTTSFHSHLLYDCFICTDSFDVFLFHQNGLILIINTGRMTAI